MSNYTLIHRAVEPSKVGKSARKLLDHILASGLYYLQPKYDGVNAVLDITKFEGVTGFQLRTRTGEDIRSCLHIIQAAADARLPAGRYFGEVWHPTLKHHAISGLARQYDSAPELVFMAFDYIGPAAVDAGFTDHAYLNRYAELSDIVQRTGPDSIFVTDLFPTPGATDLGTLIERTPAMLEALRGRGGDYDGLILRGLAYGIVLGATGSDGAIVKLKPRKTADLLCVGTFPGKGKFAGGHGGIIVSLDGTATGPTCEVGTGFSGTVRELAYLVGTTVEIEYLELTAARKLREPSYKSIRHDKQQPDNLIVE